MRFVACTVVLVCMSCGSGASSSGPSPDASNDGATAARCNAIAQEILENGGTTGTCYNVSPSSRFYEACQQLAECNAAVGDQ
jgi:hypothetical protein